MGCSECCSGRCTGMWFAGVLVNLAFVASIATLHFYAWPVALALSFLYPVLLFVWIRRFERSQPSSAPPVSTPNDLDLVEEGAKEEASEETPDLGDENPAAAVEGNSNNATEEQTDRTTSASKIPVALSLLYALLTFSVAAPGAIFTLNVLPCTPMDYNQGGDIRKDTWTTDISALPQAIQKWDKAHKDLFNCYKDCTDAHSLFAVADGTMYFRGSVEGSESQLFTMSSASELPQKLGDYKNPSWVTAVATDYVCFVVALKQEGNYGHSSESYSSMFAGVEDVDRKHDIYCGSEGGSFKSLELNKGVVPMNLLSYDGMLWFQQTYPISGSGDFEQANGYAIVSMDPKIMTPILHSVLVPAEKQQKKPKEEQPPREMEDAENDDNYNEIFVKQSFGENGNDGCDPYRTSKAQAIGILLLSALPFVILSARLWFKKAIPSSSISLFAALGLASMAIVALFEPWDGFGAGFAMWMSVAGPVWILICTYILAVSSRVDHGPLKWSVYVLTFGLFAFVVSAVCGMDYDSYRWGGDDFGIFGVSFIAWLMVFVPLGVIGIILNSTFIFILALLGTLVDICLGTVVKLLASPILAAVLVLVEIGAIAVAAVLVQRKRQYLNSRMTTWLKRCTRHLCNVAEEEEEDKDVTESLLADASEDEAPEGEMT